MSAERQVGEHEEIPEYVTHPEKDFATGGIVHGPAFDLDNPDTAFPGVQLVVHLKKAELADPKFSPLVLEMQFESTGEVTQGVTDWFGRLLGSGPTPKLLMRLSILRP